MQIYFRISLLAITLLFTSSCANKKMAALHEQHSLRLNKLNGANLSSEEKIDGLAQTYIQLLEESLSYRSVRKSVKHIKKFNSENKIVLGDLLSQIEKDQANKSLEEQARSFLRLSQKPYVSDLMTLVPKVEQKIGKKLGTLTVLGKIASVFKPKSILDSILK